MADNIAHFVEQGPEYLDRASTAGHSSQQVWDVNWGSRFPCANGAAVSILSSHVLRNVKDLICLSGTLRSENGKKVEAAIFIARQTHKHAYELTPSCSWP